MTFAQRESFDSFYARAIAPALAEKEAARRKAVRIFTVGSAAGLALSALVLIVESADGDLSPAAQFIAVGLALAGFVVGGALLAAQDRPR